MTRDARIRTERRSRRPVRAEARGGGWLGRRGALATLALLLPAIVALSLPGSAAGQDAEEGIMVAAGQWALERLPQGATRLDPHRSGAGKDAARVQRVARSLGAGLATLDETRQCADATDKSTCRLDAGRLLAIGAPRIDGDEARVKVYAWYPSESAREPVAQRSWDLVLRRSGQSWRVASGG